MTQESRARLVLPPAKALGALIRSERIDAKITQEQLAERMGGPKIQPQVSRWERGVERPTYQNVMRIAEALGIDLRRFFVDLKGEPDSADLVGKLDDGTELYVQMKPRAVDTMVVSLRDSDPVALYEYMKMGGKRSVVVLDDSGTPLEDELTQLREWLPDEMTRRMSRKLTPRVWLGMLYALGAEENWPRERMDRIDVARRRLDDEAEQGGEAGPDGG